MKSLDELQKVKKSAQQLVRLRDGESEKRIVVSMGTCGIAAGARETLLAILEELQRQNITDVTVTQKGCVGLCQYEPLVEIHKPGQACVVYGQVDVAKARQIVASHMVADQIVGEWVIDI